MYSFHKPKTNIVNQYISMIKPQKDYYTVELSGLLGAEF